MEVRNTVKINYYYQDTIINDINYSIIGYTNDSTALFSMRKDLKDIFHSINEKKIKQ